MLSKRRINTIKTALRRLVFAGLPLKYKPIRVAVFVVDVFPSKRSKIIEQKFDGEFFRLVSSTREKNQTADRVGYNKT